MDVDDVIGHVIGHLIGDAIGDSFHGTKGRSRGFHEKGIKILPTAALIKSRSLLTSQREWMNGP